MYIYFADFEPGSLEDINPSKKFPTEGNSSVSTGCAFFWAVQLLPPPTIIHGNPASLGQFPWQVALYIVTGDEDAYFCGGSIIEENWILTTADCVNNAKWATIVTGSVNMSSTDGVIYGFDKFIIHENFNKETLSGNIALVKLIKPITFNANAHPVALANQTLEIGTDVTVTGWGVTDEAGDHVSEMLNYVTLTTIANSECQKKYTNFTILDDMICAVSNEDPEKSSCTGDYGGPVVANVTSNPLQIAITSFTELEGCSKGPSGYTSIAFYRDWIKNKCGV